MADGAAEQSLFDREMLFQLVDFENLFRAGSRREFSAACSGLVGEGDASHSISPSASMPPNDRGVSAHKGDRTIGIARRQTDSAARTSSRAAGWSIAAP